MKKQYGAHAHLMCWSLSGNPTSNPLVPPPPRLPPPPTGSSDTPGRYQHDDVVGGSVDNDMSMGDDDIQTVNRFVREFVTQSLLPWMERNVVEWNEAVSATHLHRS